MRLSHRFAPVLAALALLAALPDDAASHQGHRSAEYGPHARVDHDRPFGAFCHTVVRRSHVTSDCHNPYPETDRVSLHIECARWWDLDSDGAPEKAGPAETVRLTGRCWAEVGSAWVSHRR
ncbi:hypothetical protein ACFV6E_16660 [Streptomyces sp. NPDC059785]|uniref:hypothetical protein n=1 Tax=unclassified Streptomyces TaxID=2593676 RepID=UPI00365E1FEC